MEGILVIWIILIIAFFAYFVSGIVVAIKTKDIKFKIWKILVQLFLGWGGIVATIIYLIRVNQNANK